MASEHVDRIEKILKSVNQKVQRLLKPDRFYVAFYDAERSELTFPWVVEDGQAQWDPRPYAGSEDTKGDQGNGHIRLPDLVIAQVVPQLFEENVSEQLMGAGVTYWPDDELPKSWLGAPLTSRDDTFGALVVESHTAHAFGDRGAQILSTIARQTAVAIENARLYDQLKRKIADLSAVNEIGRELTSGIRLEEQEILDLIHQQASQLMDTSNMYIALYDEETDTVSFDLMLVDGEPEEVASRSGGKGRTEWIIYNREPILIKTEAESRAWYEEQGRDEYIGEPFASWVGVPMMVGEKVLGVIAAYHKTEEYVYDDDDRQILSSMASQAAIALDNSRLYNHLEDKVNELEKAQKKIANTEAALVRANLARDFVHRLNNLAGTIPIWVDLIEDELTQAEVDISGVNTYLDKIQQDTEGLLKGAERLRRPLEEQEVNVRSMLRSISRRVKISYPDRVEVSCEMDSDLLKVSAIPTSLTNVFWSVVANGAEAILSEEKGKLTIKAENQVDETGSKWVRVEIKDTGRGIPEKNIDKVFDLSFTTKGEGRGYGLWRTKTFIESLDGEIFVESRKDIGTTFTILLPAIEGGQQ